ncbi:MAG TPA: cupin domain-containing protein [Sphingomicrobium sp.]|nr:cupin domain-containing protein [Sphingomicrobium sp.]
MTRVDLNSIERTNRTGYPPPHDEQVRCRSSQKLGPVFGLTDFGATVTTLEPGAWSSQRHWHEGEDELVVMLEGEAVLVEDSGETVMRPGDIAVFPKGAANGHHLINRSGAPCRLVAVGRAGVSAPIHYSDIDMMIDPAKGPGYRHKDGTPY